MYLFVLGMGFLVFLGVYANIYKNCEPLFMNMGSGIVVYRDEANEIERLNGWILLYGRRKVGKTFLIKNFLKYDSYFRVKRDGKILAEEFVLSELSNLNEFLKIVLGLLKENKTIVIDEFQRLPITVLEEIAVLHPKGRVIFCGSSMRVIKKIFNNRSPLLGLAFQYRLGLVEPSNMFRELLKRKLRVKQAIELAPFLSDVWTLSFFNIKKSSLEAIYDLLKHSKLTMPALIGEIFTEEERELSRVYEAILRLLGAGEWDYREIARVLADRGLIKRADSSLVLPYIKNLVGMGIVETLPLFSSKKKMYRLSSPIMEAFYYLSDRYNFEETSVSLNEVKPTLEKLRNLGIQHWIAGLFAEIYHGQKEYFVSPSKEIDFIITVRKKPIIVGEVKWGKYNNKDILKFKEKSKHIKAEKVFIVKEKLTSGDKEIKIIDSHDLAKLAKAK